MCGRFVQYDSPLIPHIPTPTGRYNVAPGTKVLILSERDGALHLDPVFWGYGPEWWDKPPLINARSETAFYGRMFRPLLKQGRAIVPADGWFEWKKTGSQKQPFFIYQKSRHPLLMAALGRAPFGEEHGKEGFVILTASSNQGMIDIHDRRPVVLTPEGAQAWLNQDLGDDDAWNVIQKGALSERAFTWHEVSKAVGSPRNQGAELIEAIPGQKPD